MQTNRRRVLDLRVPQIHEVKMHSTLMHKKLRQFQVSKPSLIIWNNPRFFKFGHHYFGNQLINESIRPLLRNTKRKASSENE